MVESKIKCANCGSEYRVSFGDRFMHGELIWSESHRCLNCDFAMEIDDKGKLPEDKRRLVLEQDGEWGLILKSDNKPLIAKVLRSIDSFSIQEVLELLRLIPGVVLKGR